MIQIYCLVNPHTKRPFYVGATKYPLNNRLSVHINESKSLLPLYRNTKHHLINYILSTNKKPQINLLHKCSLIEVDHYEEFFYNTLIKQGFKMLQAPSFSYSAKHQPGKLVNQWSKLKRKNSTIVKIN